MKFNIYTDDEGQLTWIPFNRTRVLCYGVRQVHLMKNDLVLLGVDPKEAKKISLHELDNLKEGNRSYHTVEAFARHQNKRWEDLLHEAQDAEGTKFFGDSSWRILKYLKEKYAPEE